MCDVVPYFGLIGLNIFIHINENKHINKQYITMVYDGIQKEAIRLIRICFWFNFDEISKVLKNPCTYFQGEPIIYMWANFHHDICILSTNIMRRMFKFDSEFGCESRTLVSAFIPSRTGGSSPSRRAFTSHVICSAPLVYRAQ